MLCSQPDIYKKQEALNQIIQVFSTTSCLEEQFHLLVTHIPQLCKSFLTQPNPDYKGVYFQLGHFICSILYNTTFIFDSNIPEFHLASNDTNIQSNSNFNNLLFIVNDDVKIGKEQQELINKYNKHKFVLTDQNNLITASDELFKICLQYVNVLSHFDKIFDIQYVCYIILKRLYFIFPHFRRNIEDLISIILVNLCLFTEASQVENTEEVRMFVSYILSFDNSTLVQKLNSRIELKSANVEIKGKSFSNSECKLYIHFLL